VSIMDDTWAEASLQTAVSCVLWLAYEGHPDLACRLRDEYLDQWGIHADTWNDTVDAMSDRIRARNVRRRMRWAGGKG
jgi:uncharacterized protein with NRDE domain